MNLINNFLNTTISRPVFRGKTSAETIRSSEFYWKNNLESDVFERQNTLQKSLQRRTEFGTIGYLNDNDDSYSFEELRFKKPLTLAQALDTVQNADDKYHLCNYGVVKSGFTLNEFKESFEMRFKNMKFTGFLGSGYSALALENQDGNIVKLCTDDHFAMRNKTEDFDAQVLRKGTIKKQYFYYIQKKYSKKGVTQHDVDLMEKKILSKGYIANDLYEGQIGKDKDGKIYLIDPECAVDPAKKAEINEKTESFIQECIRNGWM